MPEIYYNYVYDYLFLVCIGDFEDHFYYQLAERGSMMGECFKSDSVFEHSILVGEL